MHTYIHTSYTYIYVCKCLSCNKSLRGATKDERALVSSASVPYSGLDSKNSKKKKRTQFTAHCFTEHGLLHYPSEITQ